MFHRATEKANTSQVSHFQGEQFLGCKTRSGFCYLGLSKNRGHGYDIAFLLTFAIVTFVFMGIKSLFKELPSPFTPFVFFKTKVYIFACFCILLFCAPFPALPSKYHIKVEVQKYGKSPPLTLLPAWVIAKRKVDRFFSVFFFWEYILLKCTYMFLIVFVLFHFVYFFPDEE